MVRTTQGLTCSDVLQTNRGRNVASQYFLDLFAGVGMHLYHSTNTLFLVLKRVVHGVT